MSGAWVVGSIIAAAGVVAAFIPLWRSRYDRRARLTLHAASRNDDGSLRVTVVNGGAGDAFHAEVGIESARAESNTATTTWLGFIPSKLAETVDLNTTDGIGEPSARFVMAWVDPSGKERTRRSSRSVAQALAAGGRKAASVKPSQGLAFLYDPESDEVHFGRDHREILRFTGWTAERQELVSGYARERRDIAFFSPSEDALPDAERVRISELVARRFEQQLHQARVSDR